MSKKYATKALFLSKIEYMDFSVTFHESTWLEKLTHDFGLTISKHVITIVTMKEASR